jgi:hypothetical protein
MVGAQTVTSSFESLLLFVISSITHLDAGANPMAGDGVLLRKAESAFGLHSTIVAILRNRAPKSEIEAFDQRTATPANPGHGMRPI